MRRTVTLLSVMAPCCSACSRLRPAPRGGASGPTAREGQGNRRRRPRPRRRARSERDRPISRRRLESDHQYGVECARQKPERSRWGADRGQLADGLRRRVVAFPLHAMKTVIAAYHRDERIPHRRNALRNIMHLDAGLRRLARGPESDVSNFCAQTLPGRVRSPATRTRRRLATMRCCRQQEIEEPFSRERQSHVGSPARSTRTKQFECHLTIRLRLAAFELTKRIPVFFRTAAEKLPISTRRETAGEVHLHLRVIVVPSRRPISACNLEHPSRRHDRA